MRTSPVSNWTPLMWSWQPGLPYWKAAPRSWGRAHHHRPAPPPARDVYEHPLGHMTPCSPVQLVLEAPDEAIGLLANADRFKQGQRAFLVLKVNIDTYVFRNALCHSRLHSCLHDCPGLERHFGPFLVLLLLFSLPVSTGDLLRPLDCGSETWMGEGSHHGQLCGRGQGGLHL